VWENGGQAAGHIPTRYAGTERTGDGNLKLSRKTEWSNKGGVNIGLGQRILATDTAEYPLLEIRTLEFMAPEVSAP
jgi:type VI secretion system protein ImpE